MRRRPLAVVVALVGVSLWINQSVAAADQGVSIDLGSIGIDEPLDKGGVYRLPVMTVTNEGSDGAAFEVTARPFADQEERQLEAAWFAIDPVEFELESGSSQEVAIELAIPTNALSGRYSGLIGPSIVPDTEGASVGAGVAAKISFEVASTGWSLGSLFEDHPTWTYGALGLIGLVVAVLMLRRRYSFRIERR